MSWSWELTIELMPKLLRGFVTTIEAALLGFVVALALGLVWALARRAPSRLVRYPANGAVEFLRSTPLLVQLYFLFYVLPSFGMRMPALVTGVVGLGLHYSAYVAEIYRAGIDAVPRGQWEAARALGLPRRRVWTSVILPQALPPMLPALGNRLIAIFKETPLLAAITVTEALLVAKEFGDKHFSYLEAYTALGALFLLASLLSSAGVHLIERRVERSHASDAVGDGK